MKITKKQLEKLVLEELESSLVDEGLTDFITKGMEKLRVPFMRTKGWRQQAGYEDTKEKPPAKLNSKRIIELTAKLINQYGSELQNNNNFKQTPLFKKVIDKPSDEGALEEEVTSELEREFERDLKRDIKLKKITIEEIYNSVRQIAQEPEIRSFIFSLSADADEVFQLASVGQPKQDKTPAGEPGAEPAAGQQPTATQPAPETSGEPVATQGPPESPKSGDAPQPVASGEEAMRKAKEEATGALSASTIGDIFRDAARKIEALTDIDDKTKKEI